MNEALPPPATSSRSNTNAVLLLAVVIAVVLAAGGYALQQQLQRMAQATPEMTGALNKLRTELDDQRRDTATRLKSLENELGALRQQQAEAPATPDIKETLAPVQEKLDAIAAQLQEATPPAAPTPPLVNGTQATEAPAAAPAAVAQTPAAIGLYLKLRRKVEAGDPYSTELDALQPLLPAGNDAAIAALRAQEETGIRPALSEGAEDTAKPAPIRPWMETLNTRLSGLLTIRPSSPQVSDNTAASEPYDDALAALDAIETSLMREM